MVKDEKAKLLQEALTRVADLQAQGWTREDFARALETLLTSAGTQYPHPRELGAQRFFARVVRFTAECPHCGLVLDSADCYDVRTARFKCHGCDWTYVIGLLAWPAPKGLGAGRLPDDQIPGPRELAQLRADGGGFWMPEHVRQRGTMDMSNLTTGERPEPVDEIDLELAVRPPGGRFPRDWPGTEAAPTLKGIPQDQKGRKR